jgi:hypothetical protein
MAPRSAPAASRLLLMTASATADSNLLPLRAGPVLQRNFCIVPKMLL